MGVDRAASHETGSLRLFLAIEVPDLAKRSVAAAIAPWQRSLPDARWIPSENWHITLKFLGATRQILVPWIEETVGAVASAGPAIAAHLTSLGAFPTIGRARVLWAGVEESDGRLASLVSDLEAALANEFRMEVRPFHPHLTVARSEPPVPLPGGFSETLVSAEPFIADRLVLYRSHLERPRPRYEALRSFPLGR